MISKLNLLNDLLILKVDSVHLGRHVQFVLGPFLRQRHAAVDIIALLLLLLE